MIRSLRMTLERRIASVDPRFDKWPDCRGATDWPNGKLEASLIARAEELPTNPLLAGSPADGPREVGLLRH